MFGWTNTSRDRARPSVVCFECGEVGHFRSECSTWKTRQCWHVHCCRHGASGLCAYAHGPGELRLGHMRRGGASPPELLSAGPATSPRKFVVGDGASPPELLSAGPATFPRNYFVGDGASPPLRGTTFCRTCHLPEKIRCRGRSVTPGTTFGRTCHLPEKLICRRRSVTPGTTFCMTCHLPEKLRCRGRSGRRPVHYPDRGEHGRAAERGRDARAL